MKKGIANDPVLLSAFLGMILDGDDKHQADGPLPKEVRAELEATKRELDSLNSTVQLSKGTYRQSTQDRTAFIARVQPERFRDAVHAKVGHKDQILVDYGLSARRKAQRGTSDGVKPAEASKAERARVRLARLKAQLERAKARQSTLEARIVRQESEVAKTAPVTPPEPSSPRSPEGEGAGEPGASSETK